MKGATRKDERRSFNDDLVVQRDEAYWQKK
jgi:hypothetical protein